MRDVTSSHYKNAEDLGGALTREGSDFAATNMAADMRDNVGIDDKLHSQTTAVLNNYYKNAADGLDLNDIDNTRKKLGMVAYDSTANSNDKFAAKQAIKTLDKTFDSIQNNPDLLENGTPDAVDALKKGRQASMLQQQHSAIAGIVRDANGNTNALQSGFKALYDDEDSFNRFSPDNQQLIKNIAYPEGLANNLQTVGKLGIGGSGKINAAEAIGLASGVPLAQGAAAIAGGVGTTANMIRGRVVGAGVEKILRNLEGGSAGIGPTIDKRVRFGYSGPAAPKPPTLMLPAPESVVSVPGEYPGNALVKTPASSEILGSSPNTASENIPKERAASNDIIARSTQNKTMRELGSKRVNDYINKLQQF